MPANRYNNERRASVQKVAELEVKRKRADELKESVSTKRLRLRADGAKIATLKAIRKT
jgi:hypothetical protein